MKGQNHEKKVGQIPILQSNYEHANSSKVAPSSWERKRNTQVIPIDGGTAE